MLASDGRGKRGNKDQIFDVVSARRCPTFLIHPESGSWSETFCAPAAPSCEVDTIGFVDVYQLGESDQPAWPIYQT